MNRIGSQPTQISLYHPSKFSSNFRGYNLYCDSGYPGRGLQDNGGRLTEGALIIVVRFPHGVIEQIIVLGVYRSPSQYRGFRSSSSYLPSYNRSNNGNSVGYV